MIYFILLSTYVSSMAKYSNLMGYIWYKSFVVDTDVPQNQVMLTSEEASDYYKTLKIIGFIGSMLLLPIFGHIADKYPHGIEVMFVYGLRSIAAMSFAQMNSLDGGFPTFTMSVVKISTSL